MDVSDPGSAESFRETSLRPRLLKATNRARKAKGVAELAPSAALTAAAQAHAADMLARHYFEHTSPEGEGPSGRVSRIAPKAIVLGIRENITRSEETYRIDDDDSSRDDAEDVERDAGEVIEGWLRSPGHRLNLLSAESTHVGFGIASGVRGGTRTELVVQELGLDVGRWDQAPGPVLETPSAWRMKLFRPIEFFLKDLSRPHQPYPDPSRASVFWKGGRPLTLSDSGTWTSVQIPVLQSGRYGLLARLEGDEEYQNLMTLTVHKHDSGPDRPHPR